MGNFWRVLSIFDEKGMKNDKLKVVMYIAVLQQLTTKRYLLKTLLAFRVFWFIYKLDSVLRQNQLDFASKPIPI